jgi:thymidylate kinase
MTDTAASRNKIHASLQKRAKALLACAKKEAEKTKPVVVEFSGSPKAGKTTNIEIVAHFFKRIGFKVWTPTEGASRRTPGQLRRDLVAFNVWALSYAVGEILTAYHNVDRQHLIILDRGPFDALAWLRVQKDKRNLSADEYRRIEEFALHPKWMRLIDRIFLFTCLSKISLEREHAYKLIKGEGIAMNSGMLTAVREKYGQLRKEAKSGNLDIDDKRILNLDTTKHAGPSRTAGKIVGNILTIFEERRAEAKK